jgi:hypothetical protein
VTLVTFALCVSLAVVKSVKAGPIPVTFTSSATLNEMSGTDYFGWSGQTISISSTISNMTPTSVINLGSGGTQEVYNALISITGFQANQAGTMTLTWNPGAGGPDSVSLAMTYSNFGLTTTVTETLNNVTLANATPSGLINEVLNSPFDKITVTSNWGENTTFGADGSATSSNAVSQAAEAPEPATLILLSAGLAFIGFVAIRRRTA